MRCVGVRRFPQERSDMNSRPVGDTGMVMSSVALGTWTFASDGIWGGSQERECIRVVHAALDRGITLFDTAPNYGDGRSESILGSALRGRENGFIASKFKIDGKSGGELRRMVTDSLRRLRRDAIDIMQVHWPGTTTEETREALALLFRMRDEGLVREVGVCNFGVFDIEETRDFPIVTNQIPYSLLWRAVEGRDGIAAVSRASGRRTIAYTVLQQGLLSGRYRTLASFPEGRKRTRHFSSRHPAARHGEGGFEGQTERALSRILDLSEKFRRPVVALALGFVRANPDIDTMLLGARTVDQLNELCSLADTQLTAGEVSTLRDVTADLKESIGAHADMYEGVSRIRFPGPDGTPTRTRTPR